MRSDSTYPEANYRLGRLLASQDKLRDAAIAYRTELRFHPAHAAAWRELGLTLARLGQNKAAIATAWWQFLLLPVHWVMGPIHGAIE